MPNQKKWRSRGAEYWNSSHSIQMQTVSLGIFTIRDKSNTTVADPPFFFCLSRQIQLEWTSNSMFSQIPPEAVCLRHALIHYSAVYQEGAINIGNIFFPIEKKTWIKPQTTCQCNSLMKHIIWHIKSHASSNLGVAICGASRVTLVDRAKGLKKKWKEIFWKRSKCQTEVQRGTRRGRDVSAQTGKTTGAAVRC